MIRQIDQETEMGVDATSSQVNKKPSCLLHLVHFAQVRLAGGEELTVSPGPGDVTGTCISAGQKVCWAQPGFV